MLANYGSINIDHFYRLTRLPKPGETVLAEDYDRDFGGKGFNQSIALARAGAKVAHIGAVGADGDDCIEFLAAEGINVDAIQRLDEPTGHAVVSVDEQAENQIIVASGANAAIDLARAKAALAGIAPAMLLMQNELPHSAAMAAHARTRGITVFYSAAPFVLDDVLATLPFVDWLAVNQLEFEALQASGADLTRVSLVITRGAQGAEVRHGTRVLHCPAPQVNAVDTTGAGDTFAGYFAQGLTSALTVEQSLQRAVLAASLQTTRQGTSRAIPKHEELA